MTGLRWSRRTTTTIAEELAKLGIVVSPNTVARLCVYSKFARRTAQAELRATSTSRAAAMEKAVRAGAQLNLLTCLSVTILMSPRTQTRAWLLSLIRNSNCRWPGVLIVAHHKGGFFDYVTFAMDTN